MGTTQENPAHYYGDRIRALFFASAILSFIVIPIWGNLLPFSVVAQIVGGMTLVLLAGLTTPHNKLIMICNTLASGLGALLVEIVVIQFHGEQSAQIFLLREGEVLMLLVAFYYCVKTLRAMYIGNLGHDEPADEFAKPVSSSDGG